MFTAALLVTAQNQKQLKCPSNGQMVKLWYNVWSPKIFYKIFFSKVNNK